MPREHTGTDDSPVRFRHLLAGSPAAGDDVQARGREVFRPDCRSRGPAPVPDLGGAQGQPCVALPLTR